MVQISVSRAATGWTISIDESDERAPLGSEKSDSSSLPKRVLDSDHEAVSRDSEIKSIRRGSFRF